MKGSPIPPVAPAPLRTLVIVPVFNRRGMIVEALASIARQSAAPAAVVVVDDGSTDDSAAVVARWIEAHPTVPVHLVRSGNRGASAARNLGLAALQEPFDAVAFLDSDDLWPADFLQRTAQVLQADPSAVAVSVDRELWDVGTDTRTPTRLAEFGRHPWLWMLAHGAGLASCTLLRHAVVHEVGGFPENMPTGHDIALFGRIAARGSWRHAPGLPVVFRRHSGPQPGGQEGHLHRRYSDHMIQWAEACETMRREAPSRVRFGLRGRLLLAKRWRRAAHHSMQHGDVANARGCARRALRWWPWSLRNWRVWLGAAIARSGRASPPSDPGARGSLPG